MILFRIVRTRKISSLYSICLYGNNFDLALLETSDGYNMVILFISEYNFQ